MKAFCARHLLTYELPDGRCPRCVSWRERYESVLCAQAFALGQRIAYHLEAATVASYKLRETGRAEYAKELHREAAMAAVLSCYAEDIGCGS